MAKISIVTSGHISTNPRVWREADALAAAGHDVTVIGVWLDAKQAGMDQEMLRRRSWVYRPAADLRGRAFWHRFRARLGRTLLSAKICDPHAFGYAVDRILQAAIQQKAVLTICHLEPAMWVGTQLHKRGSRIGADIEDWHSEALPDSNPPQRIFLRALEREMLKRSVHAATTSHAMAAALAQRYQCTEPKVIYNSVPSVPFCDTQRSGPMRLLWFSQTLGKDRGLQDVFAALPLLRGDWTLELRANTSAGMRAWVESQVAPSMRSRIAIEPTVPPEQLASVVEQCDAGLAPEQPSCGNKALTIANKLFQYLQCGLSVAASDTPGQREILNAFPQGGSLYRPGNGDSLAGILNGWLTDPAKLRSRRQAIATEANQRFAYERQAKILLDSVNRALEN